MSERSGKYMHEKKYLDACFAGDIATIRYMFKYEGDVLLNSYFLHRCLNRACDGDNIDLCKIILGHRTFAGNYLSNVFLDHACKTGRLPFVKLYFEVKPETFYQDSKSVVYDNRIRARKCSLELASCFRHCYRSGNKDLIDYMHDKFHITCVITLETCMQCVCESGNIQNFRLFLHTYNKNYDWDKCLKSACIGGNIEIVRYVIQKGASKFVSCSKDIDTGCSKDAGIGGNMEIINLLDTVTEHHSNSIKLACDKEYMVGACIGGHLEIVKLMYNKIKANGSYIYTYDCVIRACENGHADIVQFLVNKGDVNLDILNSGAWIACGNNHLEIVEYLITKGANNFGHYFNYACSNSWLGLVRTLIEKGANNWNRGLEVAWDNNDVDIAKLMIERGATLNNSYFKNIRHKTDIIKLLVLNGAVDMQILSTTTNFTLYCAYLKSQGIRSIYKSDMYPNWLKLLQTYPQYVLFVGCKLSKSVECHIKRLPVELFTLLVKFS